MHHRVIVAEPAGEVVALKPMPGQNPAGNVAAQAALADDIDRLARRKLPQPFPQLVHRNVDKALDVAPAVFPGCAGVQQGHTAVAGQCVHVLQMPLPQKPLGKVVHHKPGHVHRVLGGGIGRRIRQIQILQFGGLHSGVNGGGQHIDALVHPFVPDDLRPQQAVCFLLKDHLHGHDPAARIVARMAHGGKKYGVHVQASLFRVGFVHAGDSGGQVKHLDDRTALRPPIPAVAAADVVRRNAPLPVGGTGQRNQRVLPGDGVLHLHRVAHGVNVGNRGLHAVVDHNAALDAQRQPGLSGKGGIRGDPDGQHHHVGVERRFVLQQHVHAAVLLHKALHRMAQRQPDAMPAHLGVEKRRHVRVKGIHQLSGTLDDGDLQPQRPQVFRQLQPDEAAARQHGGFGVVLGDVVLDAQGVLHGAQGEQLVQPHAGQPGLGGSGAGGQQQLVIGFLKGLAGFQIGHRDRLAVRVQRGDFVAHLHADPESGEKALRGLEGQLRRVGDDVPDEIGQAAVGVGNIAAALKHHDFRLFVQPANPGRRRCAARHAAHNDNFHLSFHLSPPCGDASDVGYVGISHLLEQAGRLTAPSPGLAVDKQRRALVLDGGLRVMQRLQRNIFAAGDMPLRVFLRGAHVQQYRPRRGIVLFHALMNIRLFEKVEKTHKMPSLYRSDYFIVYHRFSFVSVM